MPAHWATFFELSDRDALDYALHCELPAGHEAATLARLCAYGEERARLAERVRDAREDGFSVDEFLAELARFDAQPPLAVEHWPRAHCYSMMEAWLQRLRVIGRSAPTSAGARSMDTWLAARGDVNATAFPGVLRVRVPARAPTAHELYPTCMDAGGLSVTASGRVRASPPRLGSPKPVPPKVKRIKRALTPVPSPIEFDERGADPAAQRGPRGASESHAERASATGTARGYCFTAHLSKPAERTEEAWRTYTAAALGRVAAGYEAGEFRCGSGQLELCPTTGRVHWQLAFVFTDPKRMKGALATVAPYFQDEREGAPAIKPHAEAMIRTPAEARAYCLKVDTRWTLEGCPSSFDHGAAVASRSKGKGSRTDLQFSEAAAVLNDGGERALAISHPALMATHMEGIRLLADALAPPVAMAMLDGLRPHQFQHELLALAREPPDARAVHFVLDPTGGRGKSTVAAQIHADNPDHAVMLSYDVPMRDSVHLFTRATRVVVCNLPRGAPQSRSFVRDWGFLLGAVESIKDRVLMVQKYHSKNLLLERSPHVIIFANELVSVSGLTLDRPIIWLLSEPPAVFSARVLDEPLPTVYPPLYIPYRRRIFYGPLAGQRRAAGEDY